MNNSYVKRVFIVLRNYSSAPNYNIFVNWENLLSGKVSSHWVNFSPNTSFCGFSVCTLWNSQTTGSILSVLQVKSLECSSYSETINTAI